VLSVLALINSARSVRILAVVGFYTIKEGRGTRLSNFAL